MKEKKKAWEDYSTLPSENLSGQKHSVSFIPLFDVTE